jgi:hypothetical protein
MNEMDSNKWMMKEVNRDELKLDRIKKGIDKSKRLINEEGIPKMKKKIGKEEKFSSKEGNY